MHQNSRSKVLKLNIISFYMHVVIGILLHNDHPLYINIKSVQMFATCLCIKKVWFENLIWLSHSLPVSWFRSNERPWSFFKSPILEGILPIRMLDLAYKYVRFWHHPRLGGMFPATRFNGFHIRLLHSYECQVLIKSKVKSIYS
jgi:hypothetical protein